MSTEVYEGIKFNVEFVNHEIPVDKRIDELTQWCGRFMELGLTPPYPGGSAGNLSFRKEKHSAEFIITTTATSLSYQMSPDCFAEVVSCNISKGLVKVKASREPSSESFLHHAIYSARPEVNAVFHGHSDLLLQSAEKWKFSQTKRFEPYGSMALVNSMLDILQHQHFLILRDHGFVCMHSDMASCGSYILQLLHQITH